MQLRFASFAVINLRWDFHPQECARAGRTKKPAPLYGAGVLGLLLLSSRNEALSGLPFFKLDCDITETGNEYQH